jgi:xylulokinase
VSEIGEHRNILVFDAGSSALKAVVFDATGSIVARSEARYGISSNPDRLHPNEWWWAALAAAHRVSRAGIGAIVLTGTMENLIPLGEDGEPLGEAILYSDPCGAPFLAEAMPALEAAGAERLCGNGPEPLMTAFKLMWLRAHDRDRFEAARWFLPGAKDFLLFKLTGEVATDPTCAATTGLMDIAARDWSSVLRSIAGIERRRLPHVRPATDVIASLSTWAAEELGLTAGIPVINGCGDGGAATIGGGADAAGDVGLYLGTSGWVARIAEGAVLGRPGRFYRLPHPVGGGVIEIAPILAAGSAVSWVRETLGLDIDTAEQLAQQADAAPGEAVFLPYLTGGRPPVLDLGMRGAFLGLTAGDGPPELYYAALEGVALAIETNLRAMGGAGRKVSLVGGGALSPLWRQLVADIIGMPILSPPDPVSAAAFGAFRIALRALRLPVPSGYFHIAATPRPERVARAARLRARFARATELVRQFE